MFSDSPLDRRLQVRLSRKAIHFLFYQGLLNESMIVDETLAISAEIETWRKKKESREAQAGYSAWLNSKARMELQDEDE